MCAIILSGLNYGLILVAGGLVSCNRNEASGGGDAENARLPAKPLVVVTTPMIADLVRNIAGDAVEIDTVLGSGEDPHLYQPSQDDTKKLSRASAVIYNGLRLEGGMVDVFRKLADQDKLIIGLGDKLNPSDILKSANSFLDPHIWQDAKLWSQVIPPLVNTLTKLAPIRKEEFERRGLEMQKKLMETNEWLKTRVESLPRKSRVLITSHDAFQYFGRAYGFEVIGIQGIATGSDPTPDNMTRVVDLIKARGIKAIFFESSLSPATIQRIAKETGTIVGGELLSDSLGLPGELVDVGSSEKADRGTLIGMLESNMETIITALTP